MCVLLCVVVPKKGTHSKMTHTLLLDTLHLISLHIGTNVHDSGCNDALLSQFDFVTEVRDTSRSKMSSEN